MNPHKLALLHNALLLTVIFAALALDAWLFT